MKNRGIRTLLSSVLIVVMLFTAMPLTASAATYSGKCGDNLTWTFNESTGKLVISGMGEMYDWAYSFEVPWNDRSSLIETVVVEDNVTTIGDCAFEDCANLTSIVLGDSVEYIGDPAFRWCNSLANITVDDDNQYYSSDSYGVLYNKSKTKLIEYPRGNERSSFTIPGTVTTIGEDSFSNCENLKKIVLGKEVTSIEESAFSWCENLISVIIGENVTVIGKSAFYYCTRLTSIVIPNGVTVIGDYAFDFCISLTSVTIPKSITDVGKSAFSMCDSISSITVDGDNQYYSSDEYGVLYNKNKTKLIRYPAGNVRSSFKIPDSVTLMENDSFSCSENLTNITIPQGVKVIPEDAFQGCIKLNSIEIPYGVTNIGDYAFWQCIGLTEITIPNTVTYIGNCAFCECDWLSDVYYAGTAEQWEKIYIDPYGAGNGNLPLENANIHFNSKPNSKVIDSVFVYDFDMIYKSYATIEPEIYADYGAKYTITYSSSNPSVAYVDEFGEVYAAGEGSAEITCTVTDEYGNSVSDTCEVKVKYAWWQWIIRIFLLGFLWY